MKTLLSKYRWTYATLLKTFVRTKKSRLLLNVESRDLQHMQCPFAKLALNLIQQNIIIYSQRTRSELF